MCGMSNQAVPEDHKEHSKVKRTFRELHTAKWSDFQRHVGTMDSKSVGQSRSEHKKIQFTLYKRRSGVQCKVIRSVSEDNPIMCGVEDLKIICETLQQKSRSAGRHGKPLV